MKEPLLIVIRGRWGRRRRMEEEGGRIRHYRKQHKQSMYRRKAKVKQHT